MKLDVLGICEVVWGEENDYVSGNCRILNTGGNKEQEVLGL